MKRAYAESSLGRPELRPSPDSLPTTEVGRFRLIRFLARGGMGDVFHATDLMLNREVAVKVPKTDLDLAIYERF